MKLSGKILGQVLLLVVLIANVSACGQKGPLYLPEQTAPES
ncbi:lipoprotein-attachment site-containing protein [Legionella quinlivanii DSM 21216]|nr:lipoprotein [Legionella quinlivanii]MCW8451979.1 lipoprotein [Legionella quinlivanii]SEG30866.1 lipoprotein-attachment site-containing protein [Legionella quinlivanii DSM 21216]STY09824.1 Predicted small periplasmic lipoprotein [Legionella quinlivanii]